MKKHFYITGISYLLLLAAILSFPSCKHGKQQLSSADSLEVTNSVTQLAAAISRDLAAKGPSSWLDHFENSPQFFMASDGQLSFHDYQSAKLFIQDTLIKNINKITLRWSNMRIDPLTTHIAVIGSNFHEGITFASGQTLPFDGYFTGTADLTPDGWKLRNAHWSIKKP